MVVSNPDESGATRFSGALQSVGLLILRLGVGFTMIRGHGWGKLIGWAELHDRFPDPLGLGSGVTLGLVILAEVFCSALVMTGLFTRAALIPLIIDMGVAFFVVHGGHAWPQREPAFLFLTLFVTLMITGPGWYSIDRVRKRWKRRKGKKRSQDLLPDTSSEWSQNSDAAVPTSTSTTT